MLKRGGGDYEEGKMALDFFGEYSRRELPIHPFRSYYSQPFYPSLYFGLSIRTCGRVFSQTRGRTQISNRHCLRRNSGLDRFAGFFIIPMLYIELSKLTLVLPSTLQTLEQLIQDFRTNFRATGLPNQVVSALDEHLGEGESFLVNWLEEFLDNLPKLLASMSFLVLSPVIAIYLLADWKRLQVGFLRIVPQRKRVAWQRVIQDISHVVRSFIRGNLTVAIIVGILSGVGVKLMGMDYALLIGVICGVFDLIPYFGPLIGAVPAVLLGLIESPFMAIKVAIVILIVQQLEGSIISPKLMGDSVGLHPLWIIFALLAGGEIAGFWGMLFSVPIAAIIRVLIRHIYFWLVSPEIKRES